MDALKSCIEIWVFSCRHSLSLSFLLSYSVSLSSPLSLSWIHETQKSHMHLKMKLKKETTCKFGQPPHHSFFHSVILISIGIRFSALFGFVNILPKLLFQCVLQFLKVSQNRNWHSFWGTSERKVKQNQGIPYWGIFHREAVIQLPGEKKKKKRMAHLKCPRILYVLYRGNIQNI